MSVRFSFFAKTRRARRAAAAAAALAAAAAVTLASAATASAATAGNASGHAWASGVYLPNATAASVAGFGDWRGDPVDVVTAWGNRATWNDIVDPAFLYQRWQGTTKTMAFGVAMLPENVPGVSLQACADGDYDSYWRQFGTDIASYGLGRSVIRLGWEFNGNWYVWQATNPATWAACWRQIVTSARATAPDLQWDWNVNRGVSAGLADPTQAYPGDAYVTTIGVDSYDMWPGATTAANWQKQLNGTQGLNYWLSFAEAHGKKLAVPEWGNVTNGGSPGGDDPAYVNDMLGFFQANAANIAYESTFQGTTAGGNYGTGGNYGGANTPVPNAAAAYQADF
jgi:Glycosyl hydrolase family 26